MILPSSLTSSLFITLTTAPTLRVGQVRGNCIKELDVTACPSMVEMILFPPPLTKLSSLHLETSTHVPTSSENSPVVPRTESPTWNSSSLYGY
ncbi:MAG: hypothetical protein WC238_04665 [Parcubacteria group bacterium]